MGEDGCREGRRMIRSRKVVTVAPGGRTGERRYARPGIGRAITRRGCCRPSRGKLSSSAAVEQSGSAEASRQGSGRIRGGHGCGWCQRTVGGLFSTQWVCAACRAETEVRRSRARTDRSHHRLVCWVGPRGRRPRGRWGLVQAAS